MERRRSPPFEVTSQSASQESMYRTGDSEETEACGGGLCRGIGDRERERATERERQRERERERERDQPTWIEMHFHIFSSFTPFVQSGDSTADPKPISHPFHLSQQKAVRSGSAESSAGLTATPGGRHHRTPRCPKCDQCFQMPVQLLLVLRDTISTILFKTEIYFLSVSFIQIFHTIH